MTEHIEEFSHFTDAVACREYSLPGDEETSEPKGLDPRDHQNWARIEVTTCCFKLVTDLNNNKKETSDMQFEEFALGLNANDSASRSKTIAKSQRRELVGSSTRTIHTKERTWTDVEPEK